MHITLIRDEHRIYEMVKLHWQYLEGIILGSKKLEPVDVN